MIPTEYVCQKIVGDLKQLDMLEWKAILTSWKLGLGIMSRKLSFILANEKKKK